MPEIGELTNYLVFIPQTNDCFGHDSTTVLALDPDDAIEKVCRDYCGGIVHEGKWFVVQVENVDAVEVREKRVPSIGCRVSVT